MGTRGTAIFSDDTASDIREDFTTLIGDGKTAEEATVLLLYEWRSSLGDLDVKTVFWLSLALTQWKLGRLMPSVREEALRIIHSGEDLQRWACDTKLQIKRKAVLEELQKQLSSEQPPAKKVPKKYRSAENWPIGSVHAYKLNNGKLCLFRTTGHHSDKGGTSPVLEVLDWSGDEVPEVHVVKKLKVKFLPPGPTGYSRGQFLLGATSEKERKAIRIFDTGIRSEPGQLIKGFMGFPGRALDVLLARYFGLGNG